MSPEMKAFLVADDLDEALHALRRISSFHTEDAAAIRSILNQWQDAQAVSNLLMHPTLIPADIRLNFLFRGLAERQITYYVLAAVVGFQNIKPTELSPAEQRHVVNDLLAVIQQTKGVLAQRASVSIQSFLSEQDAPQILALWAHPDDTVWHNLRAWMFRTFQTRGVEAFAVAVRQSELTNRAQRQLIEDFNDFISNPPQGFDSTLATLFGCIPNLRDIDQTAKKINL